MTRKKRKTYNTNWNNSTTALLKVIVDEQGELYLDEIQQELFELGGGWWNCSTISVKLRDPNVGINYSLQVATDVASQKDYDEQEEFLEAVRSRLVNPNQLVFVDESQKDKNAARSRRCWSKRGLTPMRKVYFEGDRGKRYTMIAACDLDGFIYESCEIIFQATSSNDADPTHGTIDTGRFRTWVKEKLVPQLGKYHLSKPRSIVVMDNATIHSNCKDLIEGAGAKLIYLSAYSPELNPIELMFGLYKRYLKRYLFEQFSIAHSNALRCVSPDVARALFKHSRVPLCEHFPSSADLIGKNKLDEMLKAFIPFASYALLALKQLCDDDDDDDDDDENTN